MFQWIILFALFNTLSHLLLVIAKDCGKHYVATEIAKKIFTSGDSLNFTAAHTCSYTIATENTNNIIVFDLTSFVVNNGEYLEILGKSIQYYKFKMPFSPEKWYIIPDNQATVHIFTNGLNKEARSVNMDIYAELPTKKAEKHLANESWSFFTSPKYGKKTYRENLVKTYHFVANSAKGFLLFKVEACALDNQNDSIKIYETNLINSKTHRLTMNCINFKPLTFEVQKNEAIIVFNSDGSKTGKGFNISFSMTIPPVINRNEVKPAPIPPQIEPKNASLFVVENNILIYFSFVFYSLFYYSRIIMNMI